MSWADDLNLAAALLEKEADNRFGILRQSYLANAQRLRDLASRPDPHVLVPIKVGHIKTFPPELAEAEARQQAKIWIDQQGDQIEVVALAVESYDDPLLDSYGGEVWSQKYYKVTIVYQRKE